MKRIAAVLACCLPFYAHAGRPPAPGQLVDVGGHTMHIHCTGPQRSGATVILEAGLGGITPFYHWVQQGLAQHVRTCSYDRAGLGWSAQVDTAREAGQMARELHALLAAAHIEPPYVLAGHSLGALVALVYTHDYPQEVAGLALLDPSHPRQETFLDDAEERESKTLAAYKAMRIAAAVGATRLHNPLLEGEWFAKLPEQAQAQIKYFSNQSWIYKTASAEFSGRQASNGQAAQVRSLGDLPLIVISAGKWDIPPKATEEQKAVIDRFAKGLNQLHEQYATLSTRGRRIVVPAADHMTLIADPPHAAQVIQQIIEIVPGAAPGPSQGE